MILIKYNAIYLDYIKDSIKTINIKLLKYKYLYAYSRIYDYIIFEIISIVSFNKFKCEPE